MRPSPTQSLRKELENEVPISRKIDDFIISESRKKELRYTKILIAFFFLLQMGAVISFDVLVTESMQ